MASSVQDVIAPEQQEDLVVDVYFSTPDLTREGASTFSSNRIRWVDTSKDTVDLLEIWPIATASQSWEAEERAVRALGETSASINQDLVTSQIEEIGPQAIRRLFDCENEILKDRETYFRETNNTVPPYHMVSHVWGDVKEYLSVPTVPWLVPISSKAKLDVILDYCKKEKIKWLWIDILCINQSRGFEEIDEEKGAEISIMGEYYRGAIACLVVPEDYTNFPATYSQLMNLLFTIIESNAPIDENAFRIWEGIALVDMIMSDQWFWRMWTFQELMMPKKHVLLDGRELHIGRLRRVLDWYHKILRNGSLTKPADGTVYDFIRPEDETVITKNWRPEKLGWDLKEDLVRDGHVDLITLVAQTRDKGCKFQVDRLLGLYGMLSSDEKVPVENLTISPSNPTAALEMIWKVMIRKAILLGKVWPLLHDVMNSDPNEAQEGERWMPEITAFHRRGDAIDARRSTLSHSNSGRIAITRAGLEISVRVIGRVVGASVSLGDGGGENNKLLACIWILKAKGFNTDPIIQHLKDGLAMSDGVPPGQIEESQNALDIALSTSSLAGCFAEIERMKLRRKLAYAPSVAGWDRTVLSVQVDGHTAPIVCLAWTHRSIPPTVSKCWILDVTSCPVQSVKRWVVANKLGPASFRKIGTVRSHSVFRDDPTHVTDIVLN